MSDDVRSFSNREVGGIMHSDKEKEKTVVSGIAGMSRKNILENYTAMREELIGSIKLPELTYKGPKYVKRGSTISVDVKGLPFPDVDLWNGKLLKRKNMLDKYSVSAMFNSAGEPILLHASYDERKNRILVTLPDDAESDVLMLLFPVQEFYGKYDAIRKIDPEDLIINREIGKICSCNQKNTKGKNEKCLNTHPLKDGSIKAVRYYAVYVGYLTMQCSTCAVGCPYGAIKFDEEGACYVDIDLCRGQSYAINGTEILPDGREVMVNGHEVICWECFEGDEKFSLKCRNRKLRRVAYNGVCCGDCFDMSMITGLTFQELCSYGAVTRSGGFNVDPELCEGCFACILNIVCVNNSSGSEFDERSIRMVSYIGEPKYTHALHIDRVTFKPNGELPDDMLDLSVDLTLVLESELGSKKVKFTFDRRLTHAFDNVSIKFLQDVNFMLMKDRRGNSTINLDRGFGVASRTLRLQPSLNTILMGFSSKVVFVLPGGRLVFDFHVRHHLPLSALYEGIEGFDLP